VDNATFDVKPLARILPASHIYRQTRTGRFNMVGKARGRGYPAFGLGEAIQKAKQLYARDGKAAVSSEAAVQAWNYKGLNGASLRALAALRQYGLLDAPSAKTVKLSPTALTILLEPENSPERAEAIREAATRPAVFAELNEQYGEDLPSDPAIVSHLVRNENFSEDAAKSLIAAYRDTLDLAGKAKTADIPPRKEPGGAPNGDRDSHRRQPARPDTQGEHMEFTWPLSGDTVATLTVTKGLDAEDIETLTAYFEIAKKALAKAAKTRKPEVTDRDIEELIGGQ
jgi:hypothetical protein